MAVTESEFYAELGGRIAKIRKDRGWTQAELAARLGIGRLTVVHIEMGRRAPGLYRLHQFADVFDMPVDVLLGLAEPVGEREAWSALLTYLSSTGRSNPFADRVELTELINELEDDLAVAIQKMVRDVAARGAAGRLVGGDTG